MNPGHVIAVSHAIKPSAYLLHRGLKSFLVPAFAGLIWDWPFNN